ncbi:DHH family phosphoesterase, partial [Clostridiaceae bacterium HSG29]|nr:DHH family phosphoesterase [Clostridiaceae bacterium HSG29]
ILPNKLYDLMYISGRLEFVKNLEKKIIHFKPFILDAMYAYILKLEQNRINEYINKKEKYITPLTIEVNNKKYHIGFLFGENYVSELGNILSERHSEYDAIGIINMDYSISLRTTKDDVDVSILAKGFGGGGHPQASGMGLDKNLILKIIKEMNK